MDLNKKPFKLVSQDRRVKKGVVAGNLEELKDKGKQTMFRFLVMQSTPNRIWFNS